MDIAEIKKLVTQEFNKLCFGDKDVVGWLESASKGTLTTKGALDLSARMAKYASSVLGKYAPVGISKEDFAALAEGIVKPMLFKCQDLIAECTASIVQQGYIDAGLGLKAVKAPQTDKVENLVEKAIGYDDPEAARWLIEQPVTENILKTAVDSTLKSNAEFADKSGIKVRIRRTMTRPCCKYCSNLEYDGDLESAPDGIWSRHRYCDCLIEFWNAKGEYSIVNNYRR